MNVKKSILETKSNDELLKYLNPGSKFVSDALLMSFEILKSRGVIFPDTEILRINNFIQSVKENEKINLIEPWDKYSEENPNLLALYSEKIIWIFSTLFGVAFGSLLLSINLYRLKKNKEILIVSFFGILFPIIQFYFFNYLNFESNLFSRLISNGIGATILQFVFWQNYIHNKKIEYRKEGFTPLLLIIVAISVGWNLYKL